MYDIETIKHCYLMNQKTFVDDPKRGMRLISFLLEDKRK